MHQVAGAHAGGVQRARGAPVIRLAAFRFVDRAGRGEHAAERAPAGRSQAAERAAALLQLDQLVLAQHRQLRQRGARIDRGGIDAAQDFGEMRRIGLGVGDLERQARQQFVLALARIARLEGVEMFAVHASQRLRRR